MSEYFVRVTLNYAFTRDRLSACGSMFSDLLGKLPSELSAKLFFRRFIYGVYTAEAASKKDLEKAFRDAWGKCFPDDPDVLRIYISKKEAETEDLVRSIYTSYYGAESYMALCTELLDSIPLLKERGALPALRLQNYLFAVDGGCGFTTLLSSFSDFLTRLGVFTGAEGERSRYSEIRLRLGDESKFGEKCVDDAIGVVRDSSKGEETVISAIGFDISCFLEGSKYDELRAFVQRLYDYQDQFVFVFRVPFLEHQALEKVEDVLSDVTLLRTVEIPPLDDSVLYEHFWGTLNQLGYDKSDALNEAFFRKVAKEKKDGRFYGFKTVRKIVAEMALQKSGCDAKREDAKESVDRTVVDVADLHGAFVDTSKERTGYDELAELIGMEAITERIREIVTQVKYSIRDAKLDRPSIHMRFLGAPGTGKTTVARIVGEIFREEGILRKGAFLEYSARQLCAEYVGQTAVKTAAICRDAYGSVLFIDEAYSLYEDDAPGRNDYGKEALTTLISEMENHRDDMLVIMAGYTDEMETLMKGNTGLRSRM
ncbi:MAG: AAA family ATPase, partial [Firmicutes bacterium]|nr:AAA family ATPase [Bacillota bacterium]